MKVLSGNEKPTTQALTNIDTSTPHISRLLTYSRATPPNGRDRQLLSEKNHRAPRVRDAVIRWIDSDFLIRLRKIFDPCQAGVNCAVPSATGVYRRQLYPSWLEVGIKDKE